MKIISIIKLGVLFPLALFAFVPVASAATIDFESLQHVDSDFALHGSTYSEDGFTIVSNDSQFGSRGTQQLLFTGSTALFNNRNGSITTLTQDNGGPFSVLSIDLAELNAVAGVPVAFTGVLAGGGTVNQTFNLDNVFSSAQTFSFNASFGNLTSLSWIQAPNFHSFDNIVVNPVPLPATLWLFGSALIAFVGFGRRRKIG